MIIITISNRVLQNTFAVVRNNYNSRDVTSGYFRSLPKDTKYNYIILDLRCCGLEHLLFYFVVNGLLYSSGSVNQKAIRIKTMDHISESYWLLFLLFMPHLVL